MLAKPNSTRMFTVLCASIVALAYWLVDASGQLWTGDLTASGALFPHGSELARRVVDALVLALGAAFAGRSLASNNRRIRDAELNLDECKRQHRAVLLASLESVIAIDGQGCIVDASEAARTLFTGGHCSLDHVSIDKYVTVAAKPGSDTCRSFCNLLDDHWRDWGEAVQVEIRALDGRHFPAQARVTPATQRDSGRYIVTIHETTDCQVARKEGLNSETRYRSIVENLLDGVYRCDPEGRLLHANAAMAKMLGFASVDDLLGHGNMRDFWANADALQYVTARLEAHGELRNVEFHLCRQDGDVIPVRANIRTITDDDGATLVYEGTLSDVSATTEVRKSLESQADFYRGLTEQAPDITVAVDNEGCIGYVSPAGTQLLAGDETKLVGMSFAKLVHEDDAYAAREFIARAYARPGADYRLNCRMQCADGGVRTFECMACAFLDEAGNVQCVLRARDVFGRPSAEQDAAGAPPVDDAVDKIIHELRNELTIVGGSLELAGRYVTCERTRSHMERARKAFERCVEMLRGGKSPPDPEPAAEARGRILLVVDGDTVPASSTSMLRALGYSVSVVPHRGAALHMLQTGRVDLLVRDVAMPSPSGDELAEMARRLWPGTKILLVTDNEHALADLQRRPDTDYAMIRKPFTHKELAATVGSILEA